MEQGFPSPPPFDGSRNLSMEQHGSETSLDAALSHDRQPEAVPVADTVDQARRPRLPLVPAPGRFRGLVELALTAFAVGLATGYLLWGTDAVGLAQLTKPTSARVNLPTSYTLPARFGTIGPRLLAAGAIDYDRFVQAAQPLTDEQAKILNSASDSLIVIGQRNAYFLLDLFWAVGLTNRNRILTGGPLAQYGRGQVDNLASTGGWTLGKMTPVELLASAPLINLTPKQQEAVEAVAAAVYRPCCNNATLFPDCNHGMAMLGLLELMASQGASNKEMLEAAKYVNAFWFPQQTLELAMYFKVNRQLEFAQIDPGEMVGAQYSSGDGAQRVHEWFSQNNLEEPQPNGGGSCGV